MTNGQMHPHAHRIAEQFSEHLNELDQLKLKLNDAYIQIDVLQARIRELEHDKDHERDLKERYQRYCIKMGSGIDIIVSASLQLQEQAQSFAINDQQNKPTEGVLEAVEQAITNSA